MSEKHENDALHSNKQLHKEHRGKREAFEASKTVNLWSFLNSNFGLFVCSSVVLASLCYAVSSLYIQRSLVVGGLELATASALAGAAAMLPFALARLPHSVGWKPFASVVVLGVVGTGFAQLIVNRLIGAHGSARTMLVNYLLPGFALFYGAAILGEPITGAKVVGLALILVGVTLASGLVMSGRRPAAAVPEP